MDEWEYLSISVALKEVGKGQRAWTLLDALDDRQPPTSILTHTQQQKEGNLR